MNLIIYKNNKLENCFGVVAISEEICLKVCPIFIKKPNELKDYLLEDLNYEILNKKYKCRVFYTLKTIPK